MTEIDANDTRFQFEVIKGLSESVRDMARVMADMQKTQVGMLERLARLEANTVGESITKMEAKFEAQETRIDALFREKDQRDGAVKLIGGIRSWWPIVIGIASLFSALWLAGRSIGVVPAPPVPTAIIERQREIEPTKEIGNVH